MPVYPKRDVLINVQDFLSNPTRITRQLDRLVAETGTIADYALTTGPANQGAVIYDQVLSNSIDTDRDVEVIAPGAEFPEVTDYSLEERMARVSKYGGKVELTWEAIRRNDINEVNRKLNLLAYLVTKRVNAITVAAITANPNINRMALTLPAGGWGDTTTDPIGDLYMGKAMVDENELGYRANLGLINPLDSTQYFLGRKDIREQFPRENLANNPVVASDLGRVADIEWIKTPRVPRGTVYMLQRGVSGSVRDEEGGIQVNSFDENQRQTRVLQSWRTMVPIITDPKSVVAITGFYPGA